MRLSRWTLGIVALAVFLLSGALEYSGRVIEGQRELVRRVAETHCGYNVPLVQKASALRSPVLLGDLPDAGARRTR